MSGWAIIGDINSLAMAHEKFSSTRLDCEAAERMHAEKHGATGSERSLPRLIRLCHELMMLISQGKFALADYVMGWKPSGAVGNWLTKRATS